MIVNTVPAVKSLVILLEKLRVIVLVLTPILSVTETVCEVVELPLEYVKVKVDELDTLRDTGFGKVIVIYPFALNLVFTL